MLSDDQLGQALRHELCALGSDIHPSHDLMQRLLSDEPARAEASVASNRPARLAATRRRGGRPPLSGRLVGPRVALRGLAGAFALVVALVAVALVLAPGSGPSLVARAYAATSPQGVFVHYIQTFVSGGLPPSRRPTSRRYGATGRSATSALSEASTSTSRTSRSTTTRCGDTSTARSPRTAFR